MLLLVGWVSRQETEVISKQASISRRVANVKLRFSQPMVDPHNAAADSVAPNTRARVEGRALLRMFQQHRDAIERKHCAIVHRLKEYIHQKQEAENTRRWKAVEYTSGRLKTQSSLDEKVVHRKPFRYKELHDVPDVSGVRVIVQQDSQASVIADLVTNFLASMEGVTRNEQQDDDHWFPGGDPSRFGYRSVHRCFSVEVRDSGNTTIKYGMEVQIRSLMMHAWATMSHKLLYKGHKSPPERTRRSAMVAATLESIGHLVKALYDEAEAESTQDQQSEEPWAQAEFQAVFEDEKTSNAILSNLKKEDFIDDDLGTMDPSCKAYIKNKLQQALSDLPSQCGLSIKVITNCLRVAAENQECAEFAATIVHDCGGTEPFKCSQRDVRGEITNGDYLDPFKAMACVVFWNLFVYADGDDDGDNNDDNDDDDDDDDDDGDDACELNGEPRTKRSKRSTSSSLGDQRVCPKRLIPNFLWKELVKSAKEDPSGQSFFPQGNKCVYIEQPESQSSAEDLQGDPDYNPSQELEGDHDVPTLTSEDSEVAEHPSQ